MSASFLAPPPERPSSIEPGDEPHTLQDLYAMMAKAEAPGPGQGRFVPGEGRPHAALLFVGEQPGDQEDVQGRPFVGPAGQLLDRALDEAGISRAETYVTNAVKRFHFTQRGKKRLHQKPSTDEIDGSDGGSTARSTSSRPASSSRSAARRCRRWRARCCR